MSSRETSTLDTPGFFVSVLNSLNAHIAVLDERGRIQWVNASWSAFYEQNGGGSDQVWRHTDYLHVCERSAAAGDEDGRAAHGGIESVLEGNEPFFYIEYPCHSPREQRWFMMLVRPLEREGSALFVVTHHDITKRKLAELRIEELAAVDGLTGIANRRRFDEFLLAEWNRADRLRLPISLVIFDLDSFKRFNDNYGHLAGDECLRRVARTLSTFSRRPGDLAARYGGEEFALILGNTDTRAALQLAEAVRGAVEALDIRHDFADGMTRVTISAGVATRRPDQKGEPSRVNLVEADEALYRAKSNGRNRSCVEGSATARAASGVLPGA